MSEYIEPKSIKDKNMYLVNQYQEYNGQKLSIVELIKATEHIKIEEVPIKFINRVIPSPSEDNLQSFAEHIKQTNSSDLKYPIIMSKEGYIIDGKHRLAKAISLGHKTIKVRILEEDMYGYQ